MTDFRDGYTPTPDQLALWRDWVAGRPESVRVHAERLVPWKVFVLRTTGQFCRVVSLSEHANGDVTVKAVCWQGWAPALTARTVFGLDPEDIAEEDASELQADTEKGS